jgi:hypothetical protein
MDSRAPSLTAAEVLAALQCRGHRLSVITRVEVHEHKVGTQAVTYADKLHVSTPAKLPLTDELRDAIRANRDELLAAACVLAQPVPWLRVLVERYRSGEEQVVRRDGWKGPYRVRLAMVAANVASFMGLHPREDGPRFAPIIQEVLR